MEKEIKRGYLKWTDEDGTFHKEPLADHPDLLNKASPEQKLRAEEVRRLNDAGEKFTEEREENNDKATLETLKELKAAPAEVLTAADLDNDVVEVTPASAAEEPVKSDEPKPSFTKNFNEATTQE